MLDLTRESDDTSLGAVLDEITPGGTAHGTAAGASRPGTLISPGASGSGSAVVFEDVAPVSRATAVGQPVYVQQLDPSAPAFGAAALAGFVALLFGLSALVSASMGVAPDWIKTFAGYGLWVLFGIGVGAALLLGILGMVIGRAVR